MNAGATSPPHLKQNRQARVRIEMCPPASTALSKPLILLSQPPVETSRAPHERHRPTDRSRQLEFQLLVPAKSSTPPTEQCAKKNNSRHPPKTKIQNNPSTKPINPSNHPSPPNPTPTPTNPPKPLPLHAKRNPPLTPSRLIAPCHAKPQGKRTKPTGGGRSAKSWNAHGVSGGSAASQPLLGSGRRCWLGWGVGGLGIGDSSAVDQRA